MKKLMMAVMVLFMTSTVFSQGVDLGVKLGANFSTLSDAVGVKNRTGLHAGLFGAVNFSSLAIQAEMLYSQQGGKGETKTIDLNYINVPVFLKYYLVQGLNLQLGPQFGFLVENNIADAELNKSDISGLVGLGYDFPMGIRLEGRYILGFNEVAKNSDSKNSIFSLALGYSFL